jgi:membrane associated rhomboid family serine protease
MADLVLERCSRLTSAERDRLTGRDRSFRFRTRWFAVAIVATGVMELMMPWVHPSTPNKPAHLVTGVAGLLFGALLYRVAVSFQAWIPATEDRYAVSAASFLAFLRSAPRSTLLVAASVIALAGALYFQRFPPALVELSRDRVGVSAMLTGLLRYAWFHRSLGHLVGNALYLSAAWFTLGSLLAVGDILTTFALGAIVAALASLTWSGQPVVGMSGAVCGLIAATLVSAFRTRDALPSRVLAYLLVMVLGSIVTTLSVQHVDVAGHIGGGVAGVGCAVLLAAPIRSTARRILAMVLRAAAAVWWIGAMFSLGQLLVRGH